jgi:hypothetical protein
MSNEKALIRSTNVEIHFYQGHAKAHNVLYYWPGMDATIEDLQDDSSGGCEDNPISLSLFIFQLKKEAQSTISKCEGIFKSSSACTNPSSARRAPCSQVFHKTKRQP